GLVTGILLAWFAEEAVAQAQRLVARVRTLCDGILPHRVANLVARGVGDLLGEPARSKPRFEDPLDGARRERVVLGRVLDRCDDVVDRPGDLELEDVVELGAGRSLAATLPAPSGIRSSSAIAWTPRSKTSSRSSPTHT